MHIPCVKEPPAEQGRCRRGWSGAALSTLSAGWVSAPSSAGGACRVRVSVGVRVRVKGEGKSLACRPYVPGRRCDAAGEHLVRTNRKLAANHHCMNNFSVRLQTGHQHENT
eukprot:scaffold31982_cov57-Phaeocystis_antarctica.AAC.1